MHADRSTPNTVIGIMKVRQKSLFFLCLLGSCVPILASLVGAPRPLKNLNDSYVQKAAQFAVSEMNKQSNSLNKMVLVKVESGTVQVCDTTGRRSVTPVFSMRIILCLYVKGSV